MSLSRTTRKSYYFHEPSKPNANQLTNMRVSKCQQDLCYILMNLTSSNSSFVFGRFRCIHCLRQMVAAETELLIPCALSLWFEWSACSTPCGVSGIQTSFRHRTTDDTTHTFFNSRSFVGFFLIMAVKTLKNPYRLETVTFKLSSKGKEGKENQNTKKSYVFSGFGNGFSRGWERKSITGGFAAGRFWPCTRKVSPVGKDLVKNWEFCLLKITPIVYFFSVSVHFRSFQRYFSPVNDTSHLWAIELNTRSEIPYIRAPKYYYRYLADWKLKLSFSPGSIKVCFQAS